MSKPAADQPRATRGIHNLRPRRHRGTHRLRGRWAFLGDVAAMLVTVIVMSLIVKTFLIQAFLIPSGSMEPTLHGCAGCVDDRVVVNKQTNRMGGVKRGDIVVFRDTDGWLRHFSSGVAKQSRPLTALEFIGLAPATDEGNLVKRVIGVGGDTVEGRDGKVYVNGTQLDEPYVFPGDRSSDVNFKVTVPVGTLWVMGDHRSDSSDSRFHQQDPGKGFVPLSAVVGRAFIIVWPLNRVGTLDQPTTFDQAAVSAQP
jgi:signal peptidase I